MKEFKQAKQEYDNIQIPPELSHRITHSIDCALEKKVSKRKRITVGRWTAIAATILIPLFVIGLNVNQAFAKEMSSVPIIGKLAEVLTFRQYEINTDDFIIQVEIPTIEMISEDFNELEDSINQEIYTLCRQYADESKEHAISYREAFLETGGTLEEWIDHDIQIKIWYEVKQQTDRYLSLAIKRTESWNSASAETKFYHIDLQKGKQVSYEEAMDTTYYEDNYAVDSQTAAVFGEKIKQAVSDKDLNQLAELTAFPVYMGFAEEGIVVESYEDFIALDTQKVFTAELLASIANADTDNLLPSKAGFFLSGSDTPPSITYGIVDGQLKISGINY